MKQTKFTIMIDKDIVEWGKRKAREEGCKRQDDYWNVKMRERMNAGEFTQAMRGELIKDLIKSR